MSPGLVIVLAVAAGVPLLLGLLPALRLPGALLEIVVAVLLILGVGGAALIGVAAVVLLSVGLAGSDTPLAGRLCCWRCCSARWA